MCVCVCVCLYVCVCVRHPSLATCQSEIAISVDRESRDAKQALRTISIAAIIDEAFSSPVQRRRQRLARPEGHHRSSSTRRHLL